MRGLVVALIPYSPRCSAPVKLRSHCRGSAGGGKERGTLRPRPQVSQFDLLPGSPPDWPLHHGSLHRGQRQCLLWMPPNEQRAGGIVLVDSTNFTTTLWRHGESRDVLEESRGDEVSGDPWRQCS